jgi:trehalose 6-phosphate synthase
MASIPHHRDLFGALAAVDLVGFQTQRDTRSFATYAREYLRAVELDGKRLRFRDGRCVVADAFPIGIDAARVAEQAERAVKLPELGAFRASLAGKQVVIGVDRLDYSKGLPRRIEAFGRLLQQHAVLQRQVSLLQIAPLSRTEVAEYRDLRRHLERVIGAVNSAHATADWVPVRYVNASIGHELLMGYYRASRAGMVTPWRDGMNLVAKEYIAAQDPDDPGVLILSAGAGASEQLTEALVVNPLDIRNMADAMHKALTMPLQERRRRWEASMRNVGQYDVHFWRERFLAVLRDVAPR